MSDVTPVRRFALGFALGFALVLALAVGPAFGESSADGTSAAGEPSVLVQTETLASRTLHKTLTAYGRVEPDPAMTVNVGLLHDGQVAQVLVRQGAIVEKDQPLVSVDSDPTAVAAFIQAQSAVQFAKLELEKQERLRAQELATNLQVEAARKALTDAQAVLEAQEKLGAQRGRQTLRAPFRGIVSAVFATEGAKLAAGSPAVSISSENAMVVRLGVEPSDISAVRPGMAVTLSPVFDPGLKVETEVSAVHGMIDPATQLVDVLVRINGTETQGFTPGAWVAGTIELAEETGFAVPRQALLTDEKGSYLFLVRDGRARRVDVETGIDDQDLVVVKGDLREGDRVVVLGNYELGEGTAVREQAP